jgi:hypothetical protein
VTGGSGGGDDACSGRTVPPALESGWTVAPDSTIRTTAYRWSRWAIVTRRLMIGSFKLKFDRLNTNWTVLTEKLAVFYRYGSKNLKKSKKNQILSPTI